MFNSQDSYWTDVRPQPPVSEKYSSDNAGDEFKYTMSYVFGIDGQPTVSDVTPLSLEHGTTYVAHLRARNLHGWSDWSTDVVFSGTYPRVMYCYVNTYYKLLRNKKKNIHIYTEKVNSSSEE